MQFLKRATHNKSLVKVAISVGLVVGIGLLLVGLFGFAIQNAVVNSSIQQTVFIEELARTQQNLDQQVSKDIFAIQGEFEAHQSVSDTIRDLKSAAQTLDQNLNIMVNGGETSDIDGNTRVLLKPTAAALVDKARQVEGMGRLMSDRVRALENAFYPHADHASDTIRTGVQAVSSSSVDLLNVLNEYVTQIAQAQAVELSRADILRNTFLTVAMLGIIVLVMSLSIRIFEERERVHNYAASLEKAVAEQQIVARELADAKRGSDLIMQTVNQGLFLIDEQYRIAPQHSSELEKIFQTDQLAGRDLMLLLQSLLTERLAKTTRDYLDLLFNINRKQRAVLQVNPLDEVECSFPNPGTGGFVSKFLSFNFRRITRDGKVTRCFVAVNDITERVQLARQLRDAEQKKERQFELLLSILHIDPVALDDFIKTTKEQIFTMNDTLRAQDFAAASSGSLDLLRKRLDTIYRCVHNVKGNAAFIKFEYFQARAEDFERKLADLRNRTALGGDDFLSVVIAQSEMRTDLDELEDLRGKFIGAGHRPETATDAGADGAVASDELVSGIEELALSLADHLGKQVHVDALGFSTRGLGDVGRRAIKDVLIQLVRNSLAHGVEFPRERESAGKPICATLTIRALNGSPGEYGFIYRDDGRGFDSDKIRRRAVDLGLIQANDPRAYDDSTIVSLIFEPGFSTADEATSEAGRGMGMNIIKEKIVDQLGGEISVLSEPGRFCEFKIALPTAQLAHA
ncbi:MAG TPA: ATP-binding protein [Candidatus Baltobacteraceae bacterium]|jgi:HPt (histidine-containing phosphotransfer) domain-containing protein|nr:ATP-binding protein [Candidatus Baltobacteraceae bacterium]